MSEQQEKSGRPMKYPEISSTRHLRNSGRELLGHRLFATEKRDGSNVHFWWSGEPCDSYDCPDDHIRISSRYKTQASGDITTVVKSTREWAGIVRLVSENQSWNIFCELIYGKNQQGDPAYGPTKIEPPHYVPHLVLFDIATVDEEGRYQFLTYNFVHQQGYHFKIPVVRLVGEGRFSELEGESEVDYTTWIAKLLKWCKHHRREGVVVKCYDLISQTWTDQHGQNHTAKSQIFVKEKIDLPEKPEIVIQSDGAIILPPLADSEVYGAIDKVFADFGLDFLKDKSKAMPKFVEYLTLEARKHDCSIPNRKLYEYYITYLGSK